MNHSARFTVISRFIARVTRVDQYVECLKYQYEVEPEEKKKYNIIRLRTTQHFYVDFRAQ